MAQAHVLMADITGSTALYDQLPDHEAMARISAILDQMRNIITETGGHCVKSQGDDTLSFFSEADQVFAASARMIEITLEHGMGVHAGAYYGGVVAKDADLYGDAVNTAARLAALAKPGEVLIGDTLHDVLSPMYRRLCVSMGGLKLKGKREATQVHSYTASPLHTQTQTVIYDSRKKPNEPRPVSAVLEFDGTNRTLSEGERVTAGRSPDCHVVLTHPWVSRHHGSFELRTGQLEYTDHSSTGSTVITSEGLELTLHRQSMLLHGAGTVMIGTADHAAQDSSIRYEMNELVAEPDVTQTT